MTDKTLGQLDRALTLLYQATKRDEMPEEVIEAYKLIELVIITGG